MTVLVFGSESPSSRGRVSREGYRFAEHVDRPHPYPSLDYNRDDQAWVCLREEVHRLASLVIPLPPETVRPTFLVYRPAVVNAVVLAAEILELRANVDGSWRRRARHFIAGVCDERAPTRLRFDLALARSGVALPAVRYCAALPAKARRVRRITARTGSGVNVHMKEVLDWTFFIRLAAGRDIGVNLTQRVIELGGSLRSFRRLCSRLRPWLPQAPKLVTPQIVIDAMVRRLAPPARRSAFMY